MSRKPKSKTVRQLAAARTATAQQYADNSLYLEERRAFLDKFTLCEIACKTYVEKYKAIKKTDGAGKEIQIRLDMRTIPHALLFFQSGIPKHMQTPVFGADKRVGHKTCKKLRDGIVHGLSGTDLQEMHNRYGELICQMDAFLAFFE